MPGSCTDSGSVQLGAAESHPSRGFWLKSSHVRSEERPIEIGRATFKLRHLVEAAVAQQTPRKRVELAIGQLAALLLDGRNKVVSERAIIAAADVRVG